MLAILNFTALFFIIESNKHNEAELKNYIYSILGASILNSIALTGLLSVLSGILKIAWLPIWIIPLSVSFCWLISNDFNIKTEAIRSVIYKEIAKAKRAGESNEKLYILIGIFAFLLIIGSIGPVNHPDAANYHAAYAYQIYSQNTFLTDGDLHQGLAGLNDYAYLAFFQEGLSWLIRSSQILFLIPLAVYLINKRTNLLLILAFISAPIFIQWSTIGKPLFLADSIIAIAYLTWNHCKTRRASYLLVTCTVLGICFKISTLIIVFPILFHVLWFYCHNKNTIKNNNKRSRNLMYFLICFASSIVTISIKLHQTSNPFFPLLSRYFTPNDWQKIWFEQMVKQYNGVGNPFPVSLFVPTSLSYLGMHLGIGLFMALLLAIANKNNFITPSGKFLVGLAQILLILCIGQKRGDYYACPIIILLCGVSLSSHELIMRQSIKNWTLKFFNFIAMPIQLLITSLSLIVCISQTVMATFYYEKTMNRIAYGYHITKEIDKYSSGHRYLNYFSRNTTLYTKNFNYVASHRVSLCAGKDELASSLYECIKKYNIKAIAVREDTKLKLGNKLKNCSKRDTLIATRNIFNTLPTNFHICEI